MSTTLLPPGPEALESVTCYFCGASEYTAFVSAQDDLTGKPGDFHFVRCTSCGLAYQNPRVKIERIKDYYDDDYIAHRRKNNWGVLTPFFNWAMNKLDRDKRRICSRFIHLDANSRVLDVGCGSGTFLAHLHATHGCQVTGVDFKDLSQLSSMKNVDFYCGLFYDLPLDDESYDLITMWHFLEHDYDPLKSLTTARRLVQPDGRLLVEIPRLDSRTFDWYQERWPGLQAPQHTVLYTKSMFLRFLEKARWEVVEYLPYGAFPAYFYLFSGVAFKIRKGKGINLSKAIYPYFLGQVAMSPVLLFERHLNLAMQTAICRPRT